MTKRIAVFLPAIVMISLPLAAASPKSDGYYGKTKVAPKAQVEAHPFNPGQVKLLRSPFERAMKVNQKYLLDLDADRMLWPYHDEPVCRLKASAMVVGNSRTSSDRPPATT